jgi:hypothetical protein
MAGKQGAWWVSGIGGLAGGGMPPLWPHLRPQACAPAGKTPSGPLADPAPACAPSGQSGQGLGPQARACPAPLVPAVRP